METKMIDSLYLELSQVTKAVTNKEAMYRREVARLQGLLGTLRAEALRTLKSNTAQAAPAAVEGPVVNRATVIEWLDANDIEVTDRQMDGLFHFAAPTAQPAHQQEAQEAQERVYLVATGETLNGRELYERHEKYVPLADCETLYTAPQPSPAAQVDALDAAKQCLEMGESFRALRRVVNLLLEARRNLGPEDHELRDRIDQLLRADAALAAQEGKSYDN